MSDKSTHNICLLIPAYQPDNSLIDLVRQLSLDDYRRIVVVNDGSDAIKQPIFTSLATMSNVTVLPLEKNRGKGNALKIGMAWILKHCNDDLLGVVTLDSDGQHLPEDVKKVALALIANSDALILGVRSFGKETPLRSRFGNSLTAWIFRWKYKIRITDTQTGLRGIGVSLMKNFILLPENRYEYEMACLVETVKSGKTIYQVPIITVYINKNIASHFNPVIDSMRIYYVFMRYSLISFVSFIIDFSLFFILHLLTHTIFFSLLVGRLVSSSFNFYQNKFLVYRSSYKTLIKRQAIDYLVLATVIFVLSYILIKFFVYMGLPVLLAKILVDGFLFIVNFFLQKMWIFKVPLNINNHH